MTDRQSDNASQIPLPKYFEEDTMPFTDILLILARHIKVILITPTILCTFTIIYALYIAEPIYTSTSKIMSSSGGGSVSRAAGWAAQYGINLLTSQTEQQWAYQEIIKSRTLARNILKRKYDTEEFGPQKSLVQILTYGNDKPKFGPDTLEIMAIEILIGRMINVSEDLQTAIYTVNLHASEPRLAVEINKTLIEELDIHQKEYNKKKTSETRQFIEERIIDTEKELVAAEEALKNFMDRNRRIENSPLLQLEQQRLAREVTVMTSVFTTLKQQFETTKIEEVKESDYVLILDPPDIPLKSSKPKRTLMVIIAGLLGLGLGTVIGFISEYAINSEREKIDKAKIIFLKNIFELIPGRFKKIFRNN